MDFNKFEEKVNLMGNVKKIKPRWIIIGVVVILIVLGKYLVLNRGNGSDQILSSINTTTQQANKALSDNIACFSDESIKNGKSADCVISIRSIQDSFKVGSKENLDKLELYYQTNQSSLDDKTKNTIENSLKLYKSPAYSEMMGAYDKYFGAYIEWHKYFRDYVGIKGVDNMTTEEIMMAHTLAQEVVSTDEDLKLKVNAFNDYLGENFSQEFISATIQLSK